MRKLSTILAVMALFVLTASCGVLGLGAAGNGSTNGQASGAALKSLYSQYKSDGKVDLANLNNVISMAQLVNGIQGLKGIDDKNPKRVSVLHIRIFRRKSSSKLLLSHRRHSFRS